MSEELKPCPFCNSHSGEWRNHDKGCWFRVNEDIGKDRTPQSKTEMSKAWNTRPALDGDKELVDAFSELTTSILDNVTLEYMDEMTEGRMTKAIDAILAIKD